MLKFSFSYWISIYRWMGCECYSSLIYQCFVVFVVVFLLLMLPLVMMTVFLPFWYCFLLWASAYCSSQLMRIVFGHWIVWSYGIWIRERKREKRPHTPDNWIDPLFSIYEMDEVDTQSKIAANIASTWHSVSTYTINTHKHWMLNRKFHSHCWIIIHGKRQNSGTLKTIP